MKYVWMWVGWSLCAGCSWKNKPFPAPPVEAAPQAVKRSNLEIPRAQTFELGGRQAEGFELRVENVGKTKVEVLTAAGSMGTIAPGDVADATVGPNEMARLRNVSGNRSARLKVVYIQAFEGFLGMRYVD
ncbi:MAG: hypothetical protein AAGA48_20625 [Myxococcota bacterium]